MVLRDLTFPSMALKNIDNDDDDDDDGSNLFFCVLFFRRAGKKQRNCRKNPASRSYTSVRLICPVVPVM
jgi:hypothetical protein